MYDALKKPFFNINKIGKTAVDYKKHILLYYKFFFFGPYSGNRLNNYKKKQRFRLFSPGTVSEKKQAAIFSQYGLLVKQIVSYTFGSRAKVNIKARNDQIKPC